MPRTIKFHLDENCDPRIAAGMRLHGIDVINAAEAGLLHASDQRHIAYAAASARVIITQDADFLRMAAAGQEHACILFYTHQERTIGQVIRAAHLVWEACEPAETAQAGPLHLMRIGEAELRKQCVPKQSLGTRS